MEQEKEKKIPEIRNPWLSVWVHPKETIAKILSVNPKYGIYPLGVVGGISQAINIAMMSSLGSVFENNPDYLMLLIFVAGSALGIANMYLTAYALYFTGRLFNINGKAKFSELVTVVAWSNIVAIPFVAISALEIVFFGMSIFTKAGFEIMQKSSITSFVGIFQVVLQIWYIMIFVRMIQQVQKVDVRKAILNLLLMLSVLLLLAIVISMIAMVFIGVK
ncbi:MAG: YIP1 family protein [Kiritimatiellae bacterium]|jgi:hypothetical protein|nr:YIP1 family protein [Kiritimatiellia bacterium]